MDDAGLVREIMIAPESVIVQPLRRTIGRARNGARSTGSANDFRGEMVDCHDDTKLTFLSAGRQRPISAHSPLTAVRVIDFTVFLFGTAVLPARSCYRSEEHTSELQSLMRISYAVF